jgi:hypothetical protein
MNMAIPAADSILSTSPRSSLVSKRLIGPRSPEDSPGSDAIKRQRRKTVTWDERCDVVEFDQEEEEVAESIQDSEDNKDETESEQEQEQGTVNEFFGPDRENLRSPSPTLSGSINDAAEEMEVAEKVSEMSGLSDDETATPQKEVISLPVEDSRHHDGTYFLD